MWKHAPFFFYERISMRQNSLLLILALLLCLVGCRERVKKTEEVDMKAVTERMMYLTAQDTAAVKTLVTMFMDLAKRNSLDSAVMLLRTMQPDQQPQPLNAAERQQVVEVLGQFPVLDYRIEHLKFKRAEENEVKCQVRISDRRYVNWSFNPVRYIGRWSLCLKDMGNTTLK